MQNSANSALSNFTQFRSQLLANIDKVFEIESHIVFINKLFKKAADGTWLKQDHLTNKKSALLNDNGILIIDEIQRLVSAEGILYKKLFTAIYQYINKNTRIIAMSATPIYDNPYELALTMNLLRPRVPFPLSKDTFYSFFLGKYNEKDECDRVKNKNFITNNSCLINKELLKLLSSGYVSYFRGGNPNAYPYKRIITLEHRMSATQKEYYINALKSDIKKDKSMFSKFLNEDDMIFNQGEFKTNQKEDVVSGIYVTTQQFSNIALPTLKSDVIDNIVSKKSRNNIKIGLETLKSELRKLKSNNPETVLNYIREKGYSQKFVNIINLSLQCNGPVFIFSNWLQFGVESLSIILDACGFIKYPGVGENRYFVWSSDTSKDKPLINKAKKTFNSIDNKNGSLLKIILGTRSVMEGVSFKNVKQVHITDPWWNEARIEQILARAVRFCSHSNLPLKEQYTDIFRHYTVLPITPDAEISDMLEEITGSKTFKNFENITIEQKMLVSALKKFQINNEFEETLKQVAYDCDLNKNGNLIRLEEHIRPLNNGNYQIYFRNPKTLINYIREGIPKDITFEQIMDRDYSYPNDHKYPVVFYGAEIEGDYLIKIEPEEVLKEPEINKNLIMFEDIKCWNSPLTPEKIFDNLFSDEKTRDISGYFWRIYENFNIYPLLRTKILGEIRKGNRIEFTEEGKRIRGKQLLLMCLKKISESELTSIAQKRKIKSLLISNEAQSINNSKIIDIVFTYNFLPEDKIEDLQELDISSLNNIYKEAKNHHEAKE